ncbi:MAG: hypothetical protein AB2L14_20280 [Candidatus Xenobiia bacterium LiM19]
MSERFEEYYARRTEITPDLGCIRELGFDSVLDAPAGTYTLLYRKDDSPDFSQNACQHYSGMIGEAVCIGIQENVNSFHYEHWKEGELQRLLSYNSDYSWHMAAGNPEEWEALELFSEEGLNLALSCFEEEFHEQIRQAWKTKEIREGDQFPTIIEMEAYQGVLRHL